MTNAELVQKIRAEIEMLKELHKTPTFKDDEYEEGGVNGYQLALDKLLFFLSTLEESEKPNNPEGLDEAAKEYEHNRVFESELENYSIYLDTLEDGEEPKMKEPSKDTVYLLNGDIIDAFKAGAEWAFGQAIEARPPF